MRNIFPDNPATESLLFLPTDDAFVCIWKVIKDGRYRTKAEIVAMLKNCRYTVSTLNGALTKMRLDQKSVDCRPGERAGKRVPLYAWRHTASPPVSKVGPPTKKDRQVKINNTMKVSLTMSTPQYPWQIRPLTESDMYMPMNYQVAIMDLIQHSNLDVDDVIEAAVKSLHSVQLSKEGFYKACRNFKAILVEGRCDANTFNVIAKALGVVTTHTFYLPIRPAAKPYPEIWDEPLITLGLSGGTARIFRDMRVHKVVDVIVLTEKDLRTAFRLNTIAIRNLEKALDKKQLRLNTNIANWKPQPKLFNT